VESGTDGWDSIINKMAIVQRSSEDLIYVLDIFLKSYFNYWSSHKKSTYAMRLLKYLTMIQNTFKISIKNYMISSTFQLADAELPGYLGYKYYEYLETQYFEYRKISEIEDEDIKSVIQKGKNFFNKWRNGEIELKHYIENYGPNESYKGEINDLIGKIEQSSSRHETKAFERAITDIITEIEKLN
jgi:hypothetical protein